MTEERNAEKVSEETSKRVAKTEKLRGGKGGF